MSSPPSCLEWCRYVRTVCTVSWRLATHICTHEPRYRQSTCTYRTRLHFVRLCVSQSCAGSLERGQAGTYVRTYVRYARTYVHTRPRHGRSRSCRGAFFCDVVRRLGDQCPELRTKKGHYVIWFLVRREIVSGFCFEARPFGPPGRVQSSAFRRSRGQEAHLALHAWTRCPGPRLVVGDGPDHKGIPPSVWHVRRLRSHTLPCLARRHVSK